MRPETTSWLPSPTFQLAGDGQDALTDAGLPRCSTLVVSVQHRDVSTTHRLIHLTSAGTVVYSVIPCTNCEYRGDKYLWDAGGYVVDKGAERVESFQGPGVWSLALGIRDGVVVGARYALEGWLYEFEVGRRSFEQCDCSC